MGNMTLLAIFALVLAIYLVSAYNLRGRGNYNLQQKQQQRISRIFNGQHAAHFQFPYQVGLRTYFPHHQSLDCSGSLIDRKWVLTAAHCLKGGHSISIYLGSINFGESLFEYHVDWQDVIEHDQFDARTFIHDIAVIRIPRVQLSDEIRIIRLPRNIDNLPSYVGEVGVFAGWGRVNDSSTLTSRQLRYSAFMVIPNRSCANIFGNKIYDGKLCTEADESSACKGDSGGPLVIVNIHNQVVQIGIFSFLDSHGCERRYPIAFTRIDSYFGWIRNKTSLSFLP